MTEAMRIYEEVKELLGEEEVICRTMTKRTFEENGWTYTFLFDRGVLRKVEAYNHHELIELWNK